MGLTDRPADLANSRPSPPPQGGGGDVLTRALAVRLRILDAHHDRMRDLSRSRRPALVADVGDDESAVRLEPRLRDPVPGTRRLDFALLSHGLQLDATAQRLLIELHRFTGAALQVDIRAQQDLAHKFDFDLLVE